MLFDFKHEFLEEVLACPSLFVRFILDISFGLSIMLAEFGRYL
jgi:hypothetical protein